MVSESDSDVKPIRLGFCLIGDGKWTGGVNYQRTVFQLINGRLSKIIDAFLFVSPEEEHFARTEFGSYLGDRLIVDERGRGAGTGKRALLALATGSDGGFEDLLVEHGIDVAFENARFFGSRFRLPVLSWMPDFQHRKLPHLFSRGARIKREVGYRAQSAGQRIILLSSEAARNDCESLYPRTIGRTHVARFAGSVDIGAATTAAASVITRYGLPDRYIYMPNHFWTHKNHGLVLDALEILRTSGNAAAIPTVVMSGPTTDPRNPGLFNHTMQAAIEMKLSEHFLHLGMIPFSDVLALNSGALALLNPSLFEGWGSSVEEAKAVGTPLLLSDIPVHREQAPGALFFDPAEARDLAVVLDHVISSVRVHRCVAELKSEHDRRVDDFAASFLCAVRAAIVAHRNLRKP